MPEKIYRDPQAIAVLRPVGITFPPELGVAHLIRIESLLRANDHPMLKHLLEWAAAKKKLIQSQKIRTGGALQAAFKIDLMTMHAIRTTDYELIATLPGLRTAAGYLKSIFDPEFDTEKWLNS